MHDLMKIRPVVAELFHADGPDMKKMIAALRNFANAPKKSVLFSDFLFQVSRSGLVHRACYVEHKQLPLLKKSDPDFIGSYFRLCSWGGK
jgi:hypothetical protein